MNYHTFIIIIYYHNYYHLILILTFISNQFISFRLMSVQLIYMRLRDHTDYGLEPWEDAILSNAFSHWLSHTQNDPWAVVIQYIHPEVVLNSNFVRRWHQYCLQIILQVCPVHCIIIFVLCAYFQNDCTNEKYVIEKHVLCEIRVYYGIQRGITYCNNPHGLLLLTWINFNPNMDK